MGSPLEIYSAFQQRLQTQDYAHLGEVVDLQGYTENCLGLTGWTTGFEIALQNFAKNVLGPFSDLDFATKDVIEGSDALTIRNRVEATHSGTFLGIPPTGRRIAWDFIAMVHVKDGRVAGQWIQFDLWGINHQLTSPDPEPPTTKVADSSMAWAQSAR
jgi:predicted ester cyclase